MSRELPPLNPFSDWEFWAAMTIFAAVVVSLFVLVQTFDATPTAAALAGLLTGMVWSDILARIQARKRDRTGGETGGK